MTSRRLRRTAAVLTAVAASAGGLVAQLGAAAPRASATPRATPVVSTARRSWPPVPGNWTTAFRGAFDGARGATPDANWQVVTGTGDGLGTYMSTGVSTSGTGQLVLTASEQGGAYYAARVETKASFAPAPGHAMLVESRLSLPSGPGYWPAFWMAPDSTRTDPSEEPAAGEVDIAETINGFPWVGEFFHCGPSRQFGPCGPGKHTRRIVGLAAPRGKNTFHNYAWLWDNNGRRSYVAWYVDGQLELKVTEQQLGTRWWNAAFDHPYYLIYDVALGGWAGTPAHLTPPSDSMVVDGVRVLTS